MLFKLKQNSFAILTKSSNAWKNMPCHDCCVYVHGPGRNPFSLALVFTVLGDEFIFLNVVDSILMVKLLYNLVVENVDGHLEILPV